MAHVMRFAHSPFPEQAACPPTNVPNRQPTNRGTKMTSTEKTFSTFEQVEGMRPCVKRPITVHAKRMNEPCRVESLEGNYKQGKAGDYLMRGIDGELYICDGGIFERSYEFSE